MFACNVGVQYTSILWWVGGLGGVWFGDVPAARVRVFCYFFSVGVVGGGLWNWWVCGVGMLYRLLVVNGVVFMGFLGDNTGVLIVYSGSLILERSVLYNGYFAQFCGFYGVCFSVTRYVSRASWLWRCPA